MKADVLRAALVVASVLAGQATGAIGSQDSNVAETTWTRVQYFVGAPGVRGTLETWDNSLTVSKSLISLVHRGAEVFRIDPKKVVAVTSGGVRRTNDRVVSGAILTFGLAGLLATGISSEDHYLAIEFLTEGGIHAGVLLRLDKGNHAAITNAVHQVVGGLR